MLGKYLIIAIDAIERMLCHYLGHEPGYMPDASRSNDTPFTQNRLTHSRERFEYAKRLRRENPAVVLGAPTSHWVRESYRAFTKIFTELQALQLPLLLLQAGADSVVSNRAQNTFCARLNPYCGSDTPVVIEGAWHELLHEADTFREAALSSILDFIERVSAIDKT